MKQNRWVTLKGDAPPNSSSVIPRTDSAYQLFSQNL